MDYYFFTLHGLCTGCGGTMFYLYQNSLATGRKTSQGHEHRHIIPHVYAAYYCRHYRFSMVAKGEKVYGR